MRRLERPDSSLSFDLFSTSGQVLDVVFRNETRATVEHALQPAGLSRSAHCVEKENTF